MNRRPHCYVYIVIIHDEGVTRIGACYMRESEAAEEVKRIRSSNHLRLGKRKGHDKAMLINHMVEKMGFPLSEVNDFIQEYWDKIPVPTEQEKAANERDTGVSYTGSVFTMPSKAEDVK